MPTRAEIIAEARSWVGTRYHHQGRIRGEWVDCAGLIIGIGRALGIVDQGFEVASYGPMPVPSVMESVMDAYLNRVPRGEEQLGDIPWMRDLLRGGLPRHVGIWTGPVENTLIHAHSLTARQGSKERGWCVEQQFIDDWKTTKVVRWYSYPGVSG